MARKKENTSDVQYTSDPEIRVVSTDIATLDLEFGRADLNQMRDKINELVRKVNQ